MTIPPSLEDLQHYILSRRNGIDPEYFLAFYNANGWVQGKSRKPIKDWKAAVITWERRSPKTVQQNIISRATDVSWADEFLN